MQIESSELGGCLEDVDTDDDARGQARLLPCRFAERQLWIDPYGYGPIRNDDSGRFLNADDAGEVYVGAWSGFHPIWLVG